MVSNNDIKNRLKNKTIICSECGAENPIGSIFCMDCGQKLNQTATKLYNNQSIEEDNTQKMNAKSTIISIILIGMVVIVVILFILGLIGTYYK